MNSLRKIRIKAGLTQQMVADYLKVDRTTVSKWESGKYDPDIETLIKLASLYKVSVDELLGVKIDINVLTIEEQTMLTEFRKLNSAGRTAALGVLHAYTLMESYAKKEEPVASSL